MERKKAAAGPKSASPAWVSLFWAKYHALPEPFKKGFFALAQNIAKGAALPLGSVKKQGFTW